jgi:hypothetical protein
MEKWEYITTFFEAKATDKEIKAYIQQEFEVKKPPRYAPESMIPALNELGEQGWEVIHMEPVAGVGGKRDVRFDSGRWSNMYFCVLKRRKPDSAVPVLPVGYGQPQQQS